MLEIKTFQLPPVQTNAYLVVDKAQSAAVLIDAPMGAWAAIQSQLEEGDLKIEQCILTHAHFDHVMGAEEVRKQSITLSLHEDDRELLQYLPQQLEFFGMGGQSEVPQIDNWLTAPSTLTLLERKVEIRHVPGHAPGNIVIYFPEEKIAFVGDAIFAGSVGRTDLPGGSFEVLSKSIREQIYTLPDDTKLYPGHGRPTTVKTEKTSNPFVSA